MSASGPPADIDAPAALLRSRESCIYGARGAIVSIRRALLDGPQLAAIRAAVDAVHAQHPNGVVMISAFRLSDEFPISVGFDTNLQELADTLRAIDRALVAHATVLEFGGIRAATMRGASRVVWRLARPHAELEVFERLSDAVQWILPRAAPAGLPDGAHTYVDLYRRAARALAELDAERWLRSQS